MSGAVPSRRAAHTAAPPRPASRPAPAPRSASRPGARTGGSRDRGRYPLTVLVAVPGLLGLLLLALVVGGVLGLPGGLWLAGGAAVLLAGLLLAGLRLWNAPGPGLVGAPLTEAQEPAVWTTLVDAAARVRMPMPRHLVVDGSALIRLAPSAEGVNLAVGLPLLLQLEAVQLHAVLARELAQGSDAGPRAATRVRRLGQRLDSVLATSRGPGRWLPGRWLLGRYRRLHAAVSADAVRQAARAADDLAGTVVGRVELARATERMVGVQLAWRVLVEEYLPLAAETGARPSLAEGLHELLAYRGPGLLADARLPGNPDPLEALEPVRGVLEDAATADRIEAAVLRDDRPSVTWQQVAETVGAAETEREASRLAGAVPTGGAEPTLETLLAALERPDRPAGLAVGLAALARHALIPAGLARYTTGWAGPPGVERRDPQGAWIPWDGAPLVQAAIDAPEAVGPLRSWLIAAGADLGQRLRRYAPRATSAAGPLRVTGGPGGGLERDGRADLLVFADGVLLTPVTGAGGDGADRLAGVVRAVGDSPRTARGRWIEVGDLVAADVRERRHGLELQLRFAGGSALVAVSQEGSALRGQPVQDLRRLLAHDDG